MSALLIFVLVVVVLALAIVLIVDRTMPPDVAWIVKLIVGAIAVIALVIKLLPYAGMN